MHILWKIAYRLRKTLACKGFEVFLHMQKIFIENYFWKYRFQSVRKK